MVFQTQEPAKSYRQVRAESWLKPEETYIRIERPVSIEAVAYQKKWSVGYLKEKYNTFNFCDGLDDILDQEEVMRSIDMALAFLSNFGEKANNLRKDLPYPELNPAEEDSVDLFWRGNPRLTINFSNKLNTYGFFGKSQSRGTIKGIAPNGVIRSDLLTWLTDLFPNR